MPSEEASRLITEIRPANLARLPQLESGVLSINGQLEMGYRPNGALISQTVSKLAEITKPLVVQAPGLELSLYDAHLAMDVKHQAIGDVRSLTQSIKDTDAQLRGELIDLLQGKGANPVQNFDHYREAVTTAMGKLEGIERMAAENVPVEDPFQRPLDHDQPGSSTGADFHAMS